MVRWIWHNRVKKLSQVRIDVVSDQRLWERRGLNQKVPMEVNGGELLVGRLVHIVRGTDVHHNELGEAIRMVERQTMANSRSPIMTDHGEAVKPNFFHDCDLVQGHRAL